MNYCIACIFLKTDSAVAGSLKDIKETDIIQLQNISITEIKPSLLPMETDVISSEEDDILARESPESDHKSSPSPEDDIKVRFVLHSCSLFCKGKVCVLHSCSLSFCVTLSVVDVF